MFCYQRTHRAPRASGTQIHRLRLSRLAVWDHGDAGPCTFSCSIGDPPSGGWECGIMVPAETHAFSCATGDPPSGGWECEVTVPVGPCTFSCSVGDPPSGGWECGIMVPTGPRAFSCSIGASLHPPASNVCWQSSACRYIPRHHVAIFSTCTSHYLSSVWIYVQIAPFNK